MHRGTSPVLAAALVALALVACQSQTTTPFPAGLEPVATDPEPPPEGDAGDPYPETLALQQGSGSDYNYVFATGYVDSSIEDVWTAFKVPDVVVDRHGVSSYTVTRNVETGYDVSFLTAYTINNVVTVSFELTWREGVVAGTESAPTQVSVVYQKTKGSSYVSSMLGSIELVAVTPGVTKLEFVQRMNAVQTSSSNIASWTNELYDSVIASIHNQPLP